MNPLRRLSALALALALAALASACAAPNERTWIGADLRAQAVEGQARGPTSPEE